MQLLLLLLTSHAAGIAWADRGGAWPIAILSVSAGGAIAIGLGLSFHSIQRGLALARRGQEGSPNAQRSPLRRVDRIGLSLVLALLAFSTGHGALCRELERARAGAHVAGALDPTALRRIDARVHARRTTGLGEEVELRDVRSRPGEAAVPERMVVALTASRGSEGSRAERLLWPGTRVRLAVRITPLRSPRNPGSPDREHEWARHGVAARARLLKPDWVVEQIAVGDPRARLSARLAGLRRDGQERVRARLEGLGAGEGLVRALALGDRRGLTEATRRSFRQLGLAHLISVSGLHIGFVALPAAWLVVRLRTGLARRRAKAAYGPFAPVAAGCVAGGVYAWLSGAGVPALRASLLFALFGGGRLVGWTLPPATALASIALLLLAAEPARLFDVGARFSFGACAALIAGGIWTPGPRRRDEPSARPPLARGASERRLRGGRALCDPMRASLAVSLGMLPLVELYGLPRSLPSPLVNALAIPWAGLVVLPCALLASVLAWALPGGTGEALLASLVLPAAWLERAALALAERTPASWIGEDSPGRIAWPLALALIGLALNRLRRGGAVTATGLWLVLATFGVAPLRPPAFEGSLPRVVFFDVGQADAALVETTDSAWLIDSGPGREDGSSGGALLRGIRAQGVERLDVLVITHGDLDHRGGALRVLSALEVGELWLPLLPVPDPALEALAERAAAEGVRVRRVAAGARDAPSSSMRVEVLWPTGPLDPLRSLDPRRDDAPPTASPISGHPRIRAGPGRARNEASLVLRLELEGTRFLFTGDVGEGVEEAMRAGGADLRSEVLKVGHHGSRRSSSANFLAAVSPRLAIVTAPCGGGRGLPSLEALRRLRAAGAEIGWTGRDGAVAVVSGRASRLAMRYWGSPRACAAEFPRAETSGEGPGGKVR